MIEEYTPIFDALRSGELDLRLIEESHLPSLEKQIQSHDEAEYFLGELRRSYRPANDQENKRTKYGFNIVLNDQPAGFCLLGIGSWSDSRGYTGCDIYPHMRGRGIAPQSKPLLFYLAFELLGLHRVETGCLTTNLASKRSIEKTKGFAFEGTLRDYRQVAKGEFVDEHRWAILRDEWSALYDPNDIQVV
jgi:RimJ/RimL family protein N-acetyltransferase